MACDLLRVKYFCIVTELYESIKSVNCKESLIEISTETYIHKSLFVIL